LAPAGVARLCAAVVVIGCVAAACADSTSPSQGSASSNPQQQCVQAVFDVLSGMITRPYDNRPFEAFVTRYGTQSVTYNAYLDVFTSFYGLSADDGVRGAEQRLRPTVTKDCGASS
jgi:hypothetical protein